MTNRSCFCVCLLLLLLISASGATCVRRNNVPDRQLPILFQSTPDIYQVAETLNRSRNIHELHSRAVTVRVPDVPALSANLVWQRPKNLRIQGGLSRMLGTDFDIGSNDQAFWMSTRHGPSPIMYVARHDLFESQIQHQVLPVAPSWLIEALGVIEIDPNFVTRLPQLRPDGWLEVITLVPSPSGNYERTLLIDPQRGVSRQVVLRDPTGRLVAYATQSKHQLYDSVQFALPHEVRVQLIPVNSPPLDLQFEVAYYAVNANEGNDPSRFILPDTTGYTVVDLSNLDAAQQSSSPPAYQPAGVSTTIGYRGLELPRMIR